MAIYPQLTQLYYGSHNLGHMFSYCATPTSDNNAKYLETQYSTNNN